MRDIKGDTSEGEEIQGHNWKTGGSQMNNFISIREEKLLFMRSAENKTFAKVTFMNREFSTYFQFNRYLCDEVVFLKPDFTF